MVSKVSLFINVPSLVRENLLGHNGEDMECLHQILNFLFTLLPNVTRKFKIWCKHSISSRLWPSKFSLARLGTFRVVLKFKNKNSSFSSE